MDHEELRTHLEARLKDNPKSLIFAWLADLYLEDKQTSEAIQLCTEGIKHHPSYVTGYFILAKAYLANQENENAETALKNVLSHDREYLSAHLLLGDLMKTQGWENKAAMHYREILEIDPGEDKAKERLATLNEATTWDFSGLEEEHSGAGAQDVAIEEPEDEDWVNDIREVFPEEISAGVSPAPSKKIPDSDQEPHQTLKETLQDLDTFLDEKFSKPISETPEFFAITDTESSAADSSESALGPNEKNIASEFLGEDVAAESIQNIENTSATETAASESAQASSTDDFSKEPKSAGTADDLDTKDLITEQDFEDALGALEEELAPSSEPDPTENTSEMIPPPDRMKIEQDPGFVQENEEEISTQDQSETPPTSDVEDMRQSEAIEESAKDSLPTLNLGNLDFGADSVHSDDATQKPDEKDEAVSDSPPRIESEVESLSEADSDFGFSGLGDFISEQTQSDIPKTPAPPVSQPQKEPKKEKKPETKILPPEKTTIKEAEEIPVSADTPAPESGEADQTSPRRIITSTLGDIYIAQGQYDKAIAVYEELLEQNPEMTRYKEKIEELRNKMKEAGQ